MVPRTSSTGADRDTLWAAPVGGRLLPPPHRPDRTAPCFVSVVVAKWGVVPEPGGADFANPKN